MGTAAHSFSFEKTDRLLTSQDFKFVFDYALRSTDNCFTVLARPNQLEHARLGMALSKKMLKRAVDRNRMKRLVREQFRIHQDNLPAVDIVVLARQGLVSKGNTEIRDSLQQHWLKLRQLCAKS